MERSLVRGRGITFEFRRCSGYSYATPGVGGGDGQGRKEGTTNDGGPVF